jgi:hypothetical protein
MKFDCDARKYRRKERERAEMERITRWHDHFAWWPIKLSHGDCRWLEKVRRRRVTTCSMYSGWRWTWEYRAK